MGVNGVDPTGLMAWYDRLLNHSANFSAGASDAFTFGLTGKLRESWDLTSGQVSYDSKMYIAGGVAATAAEIGLTLGTSAAVKQGARGFSRVALRTMVVKEGIDTAMAGYGAMQGLGNAMASGREGDYGQAALQGGFAAFQGFSAYMGARGFSVGRVVHSLDDVGRAGDATLEGIVEILEGSNHWAAKRVMGGIEKGIMNVHVLDDYVFSMKYLKKGGDPKLLNKTQAFEHELGIFVRKSLGNSRGASSVVHEGMHAIGLRGGFNGLSGEVKAWTAQGYFETAAGISGRASQLINHGGISAVRRHVMKQYPHLIGQ
jgi:hypothetical protein